MIMNSSNYCARRDKIHGSEATTAHIWDVTNNIHFSQAKSLLQQSIIPCPLTTHVLVHTGKKRPVLGYELMLALGFPSDMILKGSRNGPTKGLRLSDKDLRQVKVKF